MKPTYRKTKYVHPNIVAYFPSKPAKDINIWDNLRKVSKDYPLEVQKRLEWMIFYETIANKNASYTSEYFSISRKTFHKWHTKFIKSKKRLESLKNTSRAPIHPRKWTVTPKEEDLVIDIRKKNMLYGKKKIRRICERDYGVTLSTWKIQRVIKKHDLYPDPVKKRRIDAKKTRGKANPRVRVHSLPKPERIGALWHIDSIIEYVDGIRRAIITGIDDVSKVSFARVYPSNTSKHARDFIQRLMYLTEGNIQVLHTDNGSEFDGYFAQAIKDLNIPRVYSRPHTPKDNPVNERFNRTLEDEWLYESFFDPHDLMNANEDLTRWLIKYNTYRPHESLDQLTPIEYVESTLNVLPMCPARTGFVLLNLL